MPSPQSFSTTHPLSAQIWSEGLEAEALKKISYTGMIGKRSDSCIQWKDGLSKKPGDTVNIETDIVARYIETLMQEQR